MCRPEYEGSPCVSWQVQVNPTSRVRAGVRGGIVWCSGATRVIVNRTIDRKQPGLIGLNQCFGIAVVCVNRI